MSCITIGKGDTLAPSDPSLIIRSSRRTPKPDGSWPDEGTYSFIRRHLTDFRDIPVACRVAATASLRLNYSYALERLRLSLEVFSLPAIDLGPGHTGYLRRSVIPRDHVCFSTAIQLAQGCIGELGLDLARLRLRPTRRVERSAVSDPLSAAPRNRKGSICQPQYDVVITTS